MNAMLMMLAKAYRTLVPERLRRSTLAHRVKERLLGHDWTYTADYYEREVEGPAVRSAGAMARAVVGDLACRSVIDVGCGTGALLAELQREGCRVFGLEYAEAGLRYCRSRGLEVMKFDLEGGAYRGPVGFDVAISMEVAEHLPATAADRYVDLLVRLAPVVIMTAAPPGQGGQDHVNEQPAAYWIEKMRARGYSHDEERSGRWRDGWRESGVVQGWYYNNLMVFRRNE